MKPMHPFSVIVLAACLAGPPALHAQPATATPSDPAATQTETAVRAAPGQDDPLKQAVMVQRHRHDGASEAAVERRLNEKLIAIARKFWLTAKNDGLKFDDVIESIQERNRAMEDFGLPLEVIDADQSNEFAVTAAANEKLSRPWVALFGTTPEGHGQLSAIDGQPISGRVLTPSGEIDPSCQYRVIFAVDGAHDDRGHDDYAKQYSCARLLAGDLDAAAITDIERWAADVVRRSGP